MKLKQPEHEEPEISMSPLIDCVFLLLIFFLAATMSKKTNRDINIQLPNSISAEKRLPTDNQTVIGIDKTGKFYYDALSIKLMDLHFRLRKESLRNKNRQIRLDIDKNAPIDSVVNVIDLCGFNNLQNIVFRTYDEYYNKKR
jgi:biopolymer transport protein ExbD